MVLSPAPLSEDVLATPPGAKRMLVIVNPVASTMTARLRHLVAYALQGRFDVEVVDTERKGHAIELCRKAADEGFDVVTAFGGDGTVNEAANGLAGASTPLSILPGGSNNVFAKLLGIPNDVVDATERLLALADAWQVRAVDLGRVNGRGFTFSAGVGLDASVVERVDRHPHLKARFGQWYFAHAGVTTFLERYLISPPRLEAHVGDDVANGVTAIVQNGRHYTYFHERPIDVAEGAELDSATLSAAVLRRAGPVDLPTITWRALSTRARIVRHRRVTSFEGVTRLRVASADGRTLPVQVDGDYVGDHLEAEFTVEPGVLRVVA